MSTRLKHINILLILGTVLILFGCDIDPYSGTRPSEQPDTDWVCAETGARFHVHDDGLCVGVLYDEDGIERSFVLIGSFSGRDILFVTNYTTDEHTYDYDVLLDGHAKFGRRKCTVTIVSDEAQLFPSGELPVYSFERVTEQ